jgi:hypothetical protein
MVIGDTSGRTGAILKGDELDAMLRRMRIQYEPMTSMGLQIVRRTRAGGKLYFIVNRTGRRVDRWVPLASAAQSAVLFDPRGESRTGVAAVRNTNGAAEVYLQLEPGESRVVRTYSDRTVRGRVWEYTRPAGNTRVISGTWSVRFVDGGPKLPSPFHAASLASWTHRDDVEAKRFAGAAVYRIEFTTPRENAHAWRLDLGRVCESARVRLNGRNLGTLWCAPFSVPVGSSLRPGRNVLEVEVTNLATNRIADLDRRGVPWRIFHEINFVNREYKPFDASGWPLRESGLLGPVKLVPLASVWPK